MQAKVSAVMESVETYYAQTDSLVPILSSYKKLSSIENTVNPDLLNKPVLSVYSEGLPIEWVKGLNIVDGTQVYIPYDVVHTKYLSPPVPRPRCFISSTNGLASGNSMTEAVSHAICECIERDARALFGIAMRDGLNLDQFFIDTNTIDSPVCRELIDRLNSAGISVVLWDETSDIGVPVCACTIYENEAEGISRNSVDGLFSGFGCHPSKEIAMIRALTEAIQSRLTYISGSRDDLLRSRFLKQQSSIMKQKSRNLLSKIKPVRHFSDIPSLEQQSIEEDIQVLLTMLQKRGFSSVIAVELTPPTSPIGVVRVIVPGLGVEVHNGLHIAPRTIKTDSGGTE
jgi:ribosomal protein S12 methylthiotransferase accessory factor